MDNIRIYAAITLAFVSSGTVMANNDPIDFTALTGEYVASNPGLEVAVPSWRRVDNDGDGTQDGYAFHFDVYKLGTKTKLFSTPDKYLAYAIPACPGANYPVDSEDVNFKRIGNNIILTFSLNRVCSSNNRNTGHIYTVNISSAGKKPWVKSFPSRLGTGIVPDKNGNGVDELSVILQSGTGYALTNSDYSIYVYDPVVGASVAPSQKYAVAR